MHTIYVRHMEHGVVNELLTHSEKTRIKGENSQWTLNMPLINLGDRQAVNLRVIIFFFGS